MQPRWQTEPKEEVVNAQVRCTVLLSLGVQPMPDWVLVLNFEMNAKPCSAGCPERAAAPWIHSTACSSRGRNGGGSAVKPQILPSWYQPFGDKESQSSPLRRPVKFGSCCFGGLISQPSKSFLLCLTFGMLITGPIEKSSHGFYLKNMG